MDTIKETLLLSISDTADWRMRKAIEYPDDAARNETASECLNILYNYIEHLPDDHDLFEFQKLISEFHDDLNNADSIAESLIEIINNNTRVYGFQDRSTPEDWVQGTVSEMKSRIQA